MALVLVRAQVKVKVDATQREMIHMRTIQEIMR